MLITALLPSYGYLPKMRVLDIIGEHCFIPVVVSIILGLSHNSIQAMKRLKGKTKGKIVGYNITRAIYRSRRYRLNYYYIPIVEYDGKFYSMTIAGNNYTSERLPLKKDENKVILHTKRSFVSV